MFTLYFFFSYRYFIIHKYTLLLETCENVPFAVCLRWLTSLECFFLHLGIIFRKCVKSHFFTFKSYLMLPCSSFSSNNRMFSAVTSTQNKCPCEVFSFPYVVKSNKESKNIYFQIPVQNAKMFPLLIYLIAAPTLIHLNCHQVAVCIRLFMYLFVAAVFS